MGKTYSELVQKTLNGRQLLPPSKKMLEPKTKANKTKKNMNLIAKDLNNITMGHSISQKGEN